MMRSGPPARPTTLPQGLKERVKAAVQRLGALKLTRRGLQHKMRALAAQGKEAS